MTLSIKRMWKSAELSRSLSAMRPKKRLRKVAQKNKMSEFEVASPPTSGLEGKSMWLQKAILENLPDGFEVEIIELALKRLSIRH